MKVLIVLLSLVGMGLSRPYILNNIFGASSYMCTISNGRQVCGEAKCCLFGTICHFVNYHYVDEQNNGGGSTFPPSNGGPYPNQSGSGSVDSGSPSVHSSQNNPDYPVVEFSRFDRIN